MRIKSFFTVPEGTKVSEKMFGRVLVSSVCGILLCMACLLSTTWAWFTVGVENRGSEIQIARVTADITVKNAENESEIGADPQNGGYVLETGTYNMDICLENTASGPDDLNRQQNDVYVVMTLTHDTKVESYCFAFAGKAEPAKQQKKLRVNSSAATIHFSVSWVKPASALPVVGEEIVIG